jgi:hypothetical protein
MSVASYIEDNKIEREHLIRLTTQLTESQLLRPMPAGWTVAAVLAHLALWDQRGLVLLEKWAKEGIGPSPIDTDVVNEVTRILCLAIPPRVAVQLTIDCAVKMDAAVERLSPQFAADVMEKGKTVHLNRADHRRTHLSEIEKVLGLSK